MSTATFSLTVRPLNETDSFEQLTEMLHRAYAPHAARGLRFHASYQPVEVTRSRCSEGETWVVPHDGRIVATIIFKPPGKCSGAPCYENPRVASFEQFAVDPEFQNRGIARQLMDFVEDRARSLGAEALVIDTSEHATELIEMYGRRGFKPIDYIAWGTTNYRSVVLRKELTPSSPGRG